MADETVDTAPVVDAPKRGRPPAPKTLRVTLKTDVWVDDPDNPGQTMRLETNIIQYDDDQRILVDRKSGEPITEPRSYEIDADLAKRLMKNGQAYLADDE